MNSFKVSLGSGTLKEGLIPTIPHPPMAFARTNNQEVPDTFETSMQYTLWDSGCTHSINPNFDIYTEYKYLDKGGGI